MLPFIAYSPSLVFQLWEWSCGSCASKNLNTPNTHRLFLLQTGHSCCRQASHTLWLQDRRKRIPECFSVNWRTPLQRATEAIFSPSNSPSSEMADLPTSLPLSVVLESWVLSLWISPFLSVLPLITSLAQVHKLKSLHSSWHFIQRYRDHEKQTMCPGGKSSCVVIQVYGI